MAIPWPEAPSSPAPRPRSRRPAPPATIPIWDTELNYGLAGPGDIPAQKIKGQKAAGWVVRTYMDDLRYGLARSYWYIWTQKPYPLLGIQAYPGPRPSRASSPSRTGSWGRARGLHPDR